MEFYSINQLMQDTDLDKHLGGQLLVEIDNSDEYPRVSFVLKEGAVITELVRLEHLTENGQTRALVYTDVENDDQDPVIVNIG